MNRDVSSTKHHKEHYMLHNVSIGDLNSLDLGVHMTEWNDTTEFNWQPASIVLMGHITLVTQDDGIGGTHVATYRTGGEGDLISLRIYTNSQPEGVELYRA